MRIQKNEIRNGKENKLSAEKLEVADEAPYYLPLGDEVEIFLSHLVISYKVQKFFQVLEFFLLYHIRIDQNRKHPS